MVGHRAITVGIETKVTSGDVQDLTGTVS
jgi:hypothetical protein